MYIEKLRLHDNFGRERWVKVGDKIPAGWYGMNNEELLVEHVVKVSSEQRGDGEYGKVRYKCYIEPN